MWILHFIVDTRGSLVRHHNPLLVHACHNHHHQKDFKGSHSVTVLFGEGRLKDILAITAGLYPRPPLRSAKILLFLIFPLLFHVWNKLREIREKPKVMWSTLHLFVTRAIFLLVVYCRVFLCNIEIYIFSYALSSLTFRVFRHLCSQANGSAMKAGGDSKHTSLALPASKIPAFIPSSRKRSSTRAPNSHVSRATNQTSSSKSFIPSLSLSWPHVDLERVYPKPPLLTSI